MRSRRIFTPGAHGNKIFAICHANSKSGEDMIPRVLTVAVAVLMLSTGSIAATTDFKDVLDVPSGKSPLAAESLLNGIALAGDRIVSVGQRGHIIYSDDKGKKWTQANVPVSSDLVAVYFPTALKGWAVGHDGVVLYSSDGGANWVKQLDGWAAAQIMSRYYKEHSPVKIPGGIESDLLIKDVERFVDGGPDRPFLDVWFENETTGYIVGAFNLIFMTNDGGKTWLPLIDRIENPRLLHFYSIRPVGKDLFIAGEQGLVLKLDHQRGWFRAVKTPYKGTYFGITGKPGVAIVYGLRGNAFRSGDGGASWKKIETGLQMGIVGGTVTETGRIVLVGQGGNAIISTDDGRTFELMKLDRPFPATSVVGPSNGTLVFSGLFGVMVQKIQ
jgi:photosystem II stability/assembly factor-like uncharacterized protein